MSLDMLNPVGPRHPNAQIGDSGKTPGMPPQDTSEFEEGTVAIPLPSKGYFYYPPFHGMTEIHVRPLDWRDEDILTTKQFIDDGTVFDKIVDNVIQDKGLRAHMLVPVDRNTILLWLRSQAIGEIMEVPYVCEAVDQHGQRCDHKNRATWDMTKFNLPEYLPEYEEELKNNGEIRVTLPISKKVVYIKTPLILESRDTEKRLTKKKANEKSERDFMGTGSIVLVVSGVEAEEGKVIRDKGQITQFFDKVKLPLMDGRFIRKMATEISLEYSTEQDLICEKCGHIKEGVAMPIIHQNFFWPE